MRSRSADPLRDHGASSTRTKMDKRLRRVVGFRPLVAQLLRDKVRS
jgi:hypothetical protein